MRSTKSVAVCMALFLSLTGCAIAPANETLVHSLRQRYPLSRIEVQNAAVQGTVAMRGARLRLEGDNVPAKPFHVTQLNTKSPRFHARDYARVGIASGQLVTLEPGELNLRRGTEVVVLEIEVKAGTVRLFTHTSQPVGGSGGRGAYGCTEFVFRFDPVPSAPTDAARVQQTIERWLSFTS